MIVEEIWQHLYELEEALLSPETRRDPGRVAALLTEDFKEFGSSGRIYTRNEVVASLQAESGPVRLRLRCFNVSILADGVALVAYRVERIVPGEPPSVSLRSSLWVVRDGEWRMRFHQGTRVPAEPV